jgi:hypothetical protein
MPRRRKVAAAAVLAAIAGLMAGCGGSSGSPALPQVAPAVVTPPAGAVVDARQWGNRDVALARAGDTATVQVVDWQGHGIDGLSVRIDGRAASPCDNGCYRGPAAHGVEPARAVRVAVGGRTWRFDLPAAAPSGDHVVAAAMRAYSRLHTVTLHESLASSSAAGLDVSFLFVAPDRLRYSIRGGSQAIVIGGRRWDRPSASGPWTAAAQEPTLVMRLKWDARNAHVVAPNTVTFFDLNTHAWFRVVVDPQTSLPQTVHMTGISHFMTDRYSRFDAPASIAPPPGR